MHSDHHANDDRHQDLETVFADTIWPLLPGDDKGIDRHITEKLSYRIRKMLHNKSQILSSIKNTALEAMHHDPASWMTLNDRLTQLDDKLSSHAIDAVKHFTADVCTRDRL